MIVTVPRKARKIAKRDDLQMYIVDTGTLPHWYFVDTHWLSSGLRVPTLLIVVADCRDSLAQVLEFGEGLEMAVELDWQRLISLI